MAFNERYKIFFINGSLILILVALSSEHKCPFVKTAGYTVPSGDIKLRYGEPLDIICTVDKNKLTKDYPYDSSNLTFTRGLDQVPKEMIEVMNETSIKLHIDKPAKVSDVNYMCMYGNTLVCNNVVMVGIPPQDVTDFKCISQNWDNLTCTWTAPQNYIDTSYHLTYQMKNRSYRSKVGTCPELMYDSDKVHYSCFWNVSTNPHYRQVYPIMLFRLEINNTFGRIFNNFTFEHFKHVIPNAPQDLTAVATAPDSIHLTWKTPSSFYSFTADLCHRVLYYDFYTKKWQLGGLIRKSPTIDEGRNLEYDLKGLKYAHALYDIRVSIRSAKADENDESAWSRNASTTVYTKTKTPDKPPDTNIGSFEIVNTGSGYRDVYIYWQQIKKEEENGENFSYYIEEVDNKDLKPHTLKPMFAKFTNLKSKPYTFYIWSKNEVGMSSRKSIVRIPGVSNSVEVPTDFVKTAHNESLYELSWDHPQTDKVIKNYTIFWCDKYSMSRCYGNLLWTVLPNTTTGHNKTMPKDTVYQFAISANTQDSSSGMLWAACTVNPDRNMGKMEHVNINRVESTLIELRWKLECPDVISTVKGFVISYCPAKKDETVKRLVCVGDLRNVTVDGDSRTVSANVTGLMPHTTYELRVAVKFKNYVTQFSDPVQNVTYEAAPSTAPQDIDVTSVTNDSITLKWKEPSRKNGVIKDYKIYYNDQTINTRLTEYTLTGLEGYTTYNISLKACTVACSERSKTLTVTTKMGYPKKIRQPTIQRQNGSAVNITWERPNPPRGKIDYYNVLFTQILTSGNNNTLTYNTTAPQFVIKNCGDSGRYNMFYLSVRAVNIDEDKYLESPWSDTLESPCVFQNTSWIYIVLPIAVLIMVGLMSFLFKKLYQCYLKAKDVKDVILPRGLDKSIKETEYFPDGKKPADIDRNHPASEDEEKDLLNNVWSCPSSGDSSGRSSAHDSITSSLQSATNLSTSDSGTEQPGSQTLGAEESVPQIRQRILTNKLDYLVPDPIPPKPWGAIEMPSSQTASDSPYVTHTDLNTKLIFSSGDAPNTPPPPYVMAGEPNLTKPPNPGYVSLPNQEPVAHSGYSMAGLRKDMLVPNLLHHPTIVEEKAGLKTPPDIGTAFKGVKFPWQQAPISKATTPKGYVCVGDAQPPKTDLNVNVSKGYVPHKQFELKVLKED